MSAEEIAVIVDRDDNEIGTAPRSVMREQRLIHRTTYVLVFGSDERLLVQKRTLTKDMHPGHYDLAAGGVLVQGETYDESAVREAGEELGVHAVPLQPRFKMFFEDEHSACWGWVYTCVHDGPFRLQPEEVDSVQFANVDEILEGRFRPVTPDTLEALTRYLAPT